MSVENSSKVNLTAPLVLIVDSPDSAGVTIASFLENTGWEVVQATSLERAIEVCALRRFDVIFASHSILNADIGTAIQSFRYANPEGQSTTIIAYCNEDQQPLTGPSIDPQIDLFVENPIIQKRLPVYIAIASTRRIQKISQLRSVARVYS